MKVSDAPSDIPSNSPYMPTGSPSMGPTGAPTPSPTLWGPDLFKLLFSTTGKCSGCSFQSNLYDVLTTRSLKVNDSVMSVQPRMLESDGQCFCVCNTDANGGPTEEEFEEVFEEDILSNNVREV